MTDKIDEIRKIVEETLSCNSHNMAHVDRVYNIAMHLAYHYQNINYDVLKPAVLLHDVGRIQEDQDDSGNTDHAILGAEMADQILRDLKYKATEIKEIKHCIIAHRYKTGVEAKTIEAKILFDADKLDALGAIGLARSYITAGQYGEPIYSDIPIDEYIKDNLVGGKITGRIKDLSKHTANIEFETKFKHIPERLYTEEAKQIARQRLEYMEKFFERLKQEINGQI